MKNKKSGGRHASSVPSLRAVEGGEGGDFIVYVDEDGHGPASPVPYTANAPRNFQVRVSGRTFIHTYTLPDGTWVYGRQ